MGIDKRMYFVRNIEVPEEEKDVIEYEVITDTHFISELEYGPYSLYIWEFSGKKPGVERKLCLRVKQKFLHEPDEFPEPSKKGYYHGGGLVEEVVALATLYSRARLRLGPIVRRNDKPLMPIVEGNWVNREIINGERRLDDLANWFAFTEKLNPTLHPDFILAVRAYHRGILLIEENPELAYLIFVSAIEALCKNVKIGKITLSDLGKSGLEKLIDQIEDEGLRERIKQSIIRSEPKIGKKFVKFIVEHTDDEFWSYPERPEAEFAKIKKEDLPELLKKIYDARSKLLHRGTPFPPNSLTPPTYKIDEEIDFSLKITHGDKEWFPKDYIPKLHFFERLVNHVLKNYVKRNQVDC